MVEKEVRKMHVVGWGSFPPRGCGVGTFLRDLIYNVAEDKRVDNRWSVYPIVDSNKKFGTVMDYSSSDRPHVRGEIYQFDMDAHIEAAADVVREAKRLQNEGIMTGVLAQHENGLYAEDYTRDDYYTPVIKMFYENNIPVITTLHTVELEHEDERIGAHFDKVMQNVIDYSSKGICITKSVISDMQKKYSVPRGRLIHIPHGVPQTFIPETSEELRARYGFGEDSTLFTAFGYLSRGKGLEYVIKGFPAVVNGPYKDQHPQLFIAGGTHPSILKNEGEAYRESLEELTSSLGLKGAVDYGNGRVVNLKGEALDSIRDRDVVFLNRPLTDEEIPEIIYMSDVGIVGNLNPNQYSSGPGSQWIGLGKPVIATESVFFKSMENAGVGNLVRFENPGDYTDRFNSYLGLDQNGKYTLGDDSSDMGSTMTWDIVAKQETNLLDSRMHHNIVRGKRIGEAVQSQ